MRHVIALLTILALAAPAALTAQEDFTGAWTVSFDTPNGPMDASLTLKQDGKSVTGNLVGPAGDTPVQGTATASGFSIKFEAQTPNGPIPITMSGTRDGDGLKGTFDFGQGSGAWTATRKS